ncbi:hypothetical protein TNCV_1622081 [Trichonephila clavipes]|nr:hypothetical protein TNCV_1622081 [Trichonephila clavipes]
MSYDCDFGKLWILSNSHSALRSSSGRSSASDETSVLVLLKLRKISQTHDVQNSQSISSHVNTRDNEITEIDWPKRSVKMKQLLVLHSLYQELYSIARCKLNLISRIQSTHQWYPGTSPASLLEIKCDCSSHTALTRSGVSNLYALNERAIFFLKKC